MNHGRSPVERELLRILWASPGQHLVRSEIHKRMPRELRPTLGRIGQILPTLHEAELLVRVDGRSQGSRKAGFYGLTEQGHELCRELGFEREEQLHFTIPTTTLRKCLNRDFIIPRTRASGRLIAVYGYRGGLGRTTLVAHVARGLAERFDSGKQLLVVDLSLRSPGLDAFFPVKESLSCRGLGGLLVDFQRKEATKRALWLRGALSSSEYVMRPLADVPGLVYLPSGLNPGQGGLSPSERTEALDVLRVEAGQARLAGRSDLGLSGQGFLKELREAMLAKFARAVIDPDPGHSLGAWIATQALGDQLVLCPQVTDTSAASLAGLRAVLGSFLHNQTASEAGGGVTFLFLRPAAEEDPNRWIDCHLVTRTSRSAASASKGLYRPERVPYNARLAEHPYRWENTQLYKHLIDRLEQPAADGQPEISATPELQALLGVLDPKKDLLERSMDAGVLESTSPKELARWIDWYVHQDDSLHKETDKKGEEMLKSILEAHARQLLSSVLRPQQCRQQELFLFGRRNE